MTSFEIDFNDDQYETAFKGLDERIDLIEKLESQNPSPIHYFDRSLVQQMSDAESHHLLLLWKKYRLSFTPNNALVPNDERVTYVPAAEKTADLLDLKPQADGVIRFSETSLDSFLRITKTHQKKVSNAGAKKMDPTSPNRTAITQVKQSLQKKKVLSITKTGIVELRLPTKRAQRAIQIEPVAEPEAEIPDLPFPPPVMPATPTLELVVEQGGNVTTPQHAAADEENVQDYEQWFYEASDPRFDGF